MKSRIKRLLLVLWMVALAPVVGCASVGSTGPENHRTLSRVADYDTRMIVDDVNLLILTQRPFRGSYWVVE